MAKGDRLARLDAHREEMEGEYREALIAALRTTAAGKWGCSTIARTGWRVPQRRRSSPS